MHGSLLIALFLGGGGVGSCVAGILNDDHLLKYLLK